MPLLASLKLAPQSHEAGPPPRWMKGAVQMCVYIFPSSLSCLSFTSSYSHFSLDVSLAIFTIHVKSRNNIGNKSVICRLLRGKDFQFSKIYNFAAVQKLFVI
jgi:hypothetical protein